MSGNSVNLEQLLNIPSKLEALDIFHFEISGTDFKEVQLKKFFHN